GILSVLRMDANGDWQKIDLVRGLTRSQHDHLLNGVEYIIDKNGAPALLVSVGGHTNAGAPSAPLGYLPEYVLSGAVLKVDLNATTAMTVKTDSYGQKYYFNLPTLDDPTRPGVNEGVDASIEIFGGHGGLNQAKYDPNGPVTFYATGLRNATEILECPSENILSCMPRFAACCDKHGSWTTPPRPKGCFATSPSVSNENGRGSPARSWKASTKSSPSRDLDCRRSCGARSPVPTSSRMP